MKIISLTLLATTLLMAGTAIGQNKFFTRNGHIWFYSSTPVEDIEAHNHKVTSVMDIESGKLEFAALMKSFEFEKALMEEHFNENYVESATYPKAVFKGNVKDYQPGTYDQFTDVIAEGQLTIHGVTRDVEIPGKLRITDKGVEIEAIFMIKPEDYDIEIPNTVRDNIAKEIKVTVECELAPLKK